MSATTTRFRTHVEERLNEPATFFVGGQQYVPKIIRFEESRDGQSISILFEMHELSTSGEYRVIDDRFIPPLGIGPKVEQTSSDARDSDEGHYFEIELGSGSEEIDDDVLIHRGQTRFRYVFSEESGKPDARSRIWSEFEEFLGHVTEIERQDRAGERDRYDEIFRSVLEFEQPDIAVQVEGRELARSLSEKGDTVARSALVLLGVYYAIAFMALSSLILILAIIVGFTMIVKHQIAVEIGAIVFAILVECMKRSLALAQRQHILARVYKETTVQIIQTVRIARATPAADLQAATNRVNDIVGSSIKACQETVTLFGRNPEAFDLVLESLETGFSKPSKLAG